MERASLLEVARVATDEDIARRVAEWFLENGWEDPEGLATRLVQTLGRKTLRELARTPLTTSMICEVFLADAAAELSMSRSGLYRAFCALRFRRLPEIGPAVLPRLAYDLRADGNILAAAQTYVQCYWQDFPGLTGTPDEVANQVLERSGLFVKEGADYRFIDRSIQDFLSAEFIAAYYRPVFVSRWKHLRPRSSSSST